MSGPGQPSFATEGGVSETEARDELERLLQDPHFRASPRSKKLLRYLAEAALQGRASDLKAYSVAIDVLERPTSFDPTIDPVVRVEASRLRATLDQYYERSGQACQVHITLPKGGYAPFFRRAGPRDAPTPETGSDEVPFPGPRHRIVPSLADILALTAAIGLLGFAFFLSARMPPLSPMAFSEIPLLTVQVESDVTGSDDEIAQMEDRLMVLLSQFHNVQVLFGTGPAYPASDVAASTAFLDDLVVEPVEATAATRPRTTRTRLTRRAYRLSVRYKQAGAASILSWKLFAGDHNEILMSGRHSFDAATGGIEDALARIAVTIAASDGMIPSLETAAELKMPTLGYGCVLRARLALNSSDASLSEDAFACLERTIDIHDGDANAHAALANLLVAKYPVGNPTKLSRARQLADRAAALAPYSHRAFEAQMLALESVGEDKAALAAGRRAVSLNPYCGRALGKLSRIAAGLGSWDKSVDYARKAVAVAAIPSPDAVLTLALDDYRLGRFAEALARIEELGPIDRFTVKALAVAARAQLDQPLDDVSDIIDAGFPETFRAAMRARHFRDDIIAMLESGLAKARRLGTH